MTLAEYMTKLHQYFLEHYDGEIYEILENPKRKELVVRVKDTHGFCDWWDAAYILPTSWIHEYDYALSVSSRGVVFENFREQ